MDFLERRSKILKLRNIGTVIDVGANKGQFALELRRIGYAGRIISFEPLDDAFTELRETAAKDELWQCYNFGLGDSDRRDVINVSENSHSSSLLPVSPRSVAIEPTIAYIRKQAVTLRRLDNVFDEICTPADSVYLKIDTQGYEIPVLNGALSVIRRIDLIQLETSFFPVYVGERLVGDVINFLGCLGFRVIAIEPGWEDPDTGEMLQADMIFARR